MHKKYAQIQWEGPKIQKPSLKTFLAKSQVLALDSNLLKQTIIDRPIKRTGVGAATDSRQLLDY